MAKLIAPLLSFRAHGSLTRSLSYKRLRRLNLAGAVPTHPDARTLPQLYQRWRFVDARYYWHSLSAAARATWETNARPTNTTGWAYFLSSYLSNPTDQVLWLRLDSLDNLTAPDSSGKGNHAELTWTTSSPGVIDRARTFNEWVGSLEVPHHSSLSPSDAITLSTWLKADDDLTTIWNTTAIFGKLAASNGYNLFLIPGPVRWRFGSGDGAILYANLGTPWPDLDWHHLAITYEGSQAISYVDGLPHESSNNVRPSLGDSGLSLGVNVTFGLSFLNHMDDIRLYNRALSPAHIRDIATTQYYPTPVI